MLISARSPIGTWGASIAANRYGSRYADAKLASIALEHASNRGHGTLAVDCYRVLTALGRAYVGRPVVIRDAYVDEIDLEQLPDGSPQIEFSECSIGKIFVLREIDGKDCPRFSNCLIEALIGRVSRADLPSEVFDEFCHFETFSSYDYTTASMMQLNVGLGVKVLMTVIKKLYLQSGSRRQENALVRGLDQNARSLVPSVLSILEANKMAKRLNLDHRIVWVPNRAHYGRIFAILEAPSESKDDLVIAASEL